VLPKELFGCLTIPSAWLMVQNHLLHRLSLLSLGHQLSVANPPPSQLGRKIEILRIGWIDMTRLARGLMAIVVVDVSETRLIHRIFDERLVDVSLAFACFAKTILVP
jgi:hypothetical protein